MSSKLPGGGPSPLGLNWLADGYPDLAYGEGVAEGLFPAEALGISGVPDGSQVSDAAHSHLPKSAILIPDEFLLETTASTHDFFADAEAPIDMGDFLKESSVTDLSWLELTPQDLTRLPKNPVNLGIKELEEEWSKGRDLRPSNFALLQNVELQPKTATPVKKSSSLVELVQKAMRRSAQGDSWGEIESDLKVALDGDVSQIKKALALIKDEHLLAGKVFIRAEAYPGCTNGTWTESVKTASASAKYIVAKSGCAGCVFNQDTRCAVFKKSLVASVPWEEAAESFEPFLKASGRDLSPELGPKASLKKAFAQAPKSFESSARALPGTVRKAKEIPLEKAVANLAQATPTIASVESSVEKKHLESKIAKVVSAIENGLRGSLLRSLITRTLTAQEVPFASKVLDPLLKKTGALQEVTYKKVFEGTSFTEAPRVVSAAATSPKEVASLLRWARQKLNEGSLGTELDTFLKVRFASKLLKEAAAPLRALREEHEGLAGHLYVEAAAYASLKGTEGCDKGAFQHRSNNVKYVMAMDRCGSCAFANTDSTGDRFCQKYGKQLAEEFPEDGKKAYQQETLRLANGSDADRTAALFSSYDPTEFGLQKSSALDDFDYLAAPIEGLQGIVFGGMFASLDGEDGDE